ncbi:uncharacterized protein LACBIDRAFT_328749 [Laccaria bicolor S238N-H82]|uniref:Predicted protein n=1 Tax=Laccaria bicolor (strain S238N-H82 / ATCC MYA-4686) TaxID=486041 RepID=B0DFV8_LACBS|nr:uncharacterized protein LACBIDRAFT_328749 [Laccaria bicolor S238N-H82]EDR06412.1 predicted protein [Laccaria bicolor S238N-H82]|eukprot:XP_001882784.1 predicted protein [Laccaria bicolor S238N-H82]
MRTSFCPLLTMSTWKPASGHILYLSALHSCYSISTLSGALSLCISNCCSDHLRRPRTPELQSPRILFQTTPVCTAWSSAKPHEGVLPSFNAKESVTQNQFFSIIQTNEYRSSGRARLSKLSAHGLLLTLMPSKKLSDAERLAALEAENKRLKRQARAQKYFESRVTLSKQRKPVVEKVVLLIQAEINFYHQFQDGWPIRDILARYLSNKSSRNKQDIEAERKDAKADSRKRRRDASENSSDEEEGEDQEDEEDSAGEDELHKGYDTDHEDLAKGKRKRKGPSPSRGKARIRDAEPAKKKSDKRAVELMFLKKSSVPTKRAKKIKAKKNIIVSDSEDGEQRRRSVSLAGENSPRRRTDLVHAKGKAGSHQDLTAIDHTDNLATRSKGKSVRAFSELTNANEISTFRDNLSLINQCPVVGCDEDMPVEPSDALTDLIHTYNELRCVSEPFDNGEHLTEVKDAICTEIRAGNVKMDGQDQAWTDFCEKVPDIDALRRDLSIQKRVAYLKNVGYFGGMGEFVIMNTLTAACRIYRPELFAPLEPREFLDFIVIPHVATFLMAQDYHDGDIDKPQFLGCYRRMLWSSAEYGRIVFPWPRHDNKDATIIEEANEKLSDYIKLERPRENSKHQDISLKSPSPSNAKARVPSISATSPHRSEEIGHAPEGGPNERRARCQPALEHMDCDPVVPPKIRDKKQRPRQIETLKSVTLSTHPEGRTNSYSPLQNTLEGIGWGHRTHMFLIVLNVGRMMVFAPTIFFALSLAASAYTL